MAPDDRVDLLKLVDPAVVERLLPLLPTEDRRDINRLSLTPGGDGRLVDDDLRRPASESVTVGDARRRSPFKPRTTKRSITSTSSTAKTTSAA